MSAKFRFLSICLLVLAAVACQEITPAPLTPTPTPSATPTLMPLPKNYLSTPIDCEGVDPYIAAQQHDLALQIYQSILTATPLASCAFEGMAEVNATLTAAATSAFDSAEAYAHMGDFGSAAAQWKEAVKAEPNSDRLKSGIPWWVYWTLYWPWILAMLLLLGLGSQYLLPYLRTHYDIDALAVAGVVLPAGEKADGLDEQAQRALEKALEDMARAKPLTGPDLVDKPIQPPDLPAELSTQGNAIWKFLAAILPSGLNTLSGSFAFDKERGAGLAVKLVRMRGNAVLRSETFWQRDWDPEFKPGSDSVARKAYFYLCDLAGKWLYFEMFRQRQREAQLREFFWTDDFKSHLYVAASMRADDPQAVQRFATLALERDPSNRSANLSLGWALFDEYGEARFKLAKLQPEHLDLLAQALAECRQACDGLSAQDGAARQQMLVQARYLEGIICLEKYSESRSKADLQDALDALKQSYDIASTLRKDAAAGKGLTEEYLWVLEIPLLSARTFNHEETYADIQRISKKTRSPRVHYNIACHFNMLALLEPGAHDHRQRALESLEKAFRLRPDYAAAARRDASLRGLTETKAFQALCEKYGPPSTLPATLGEYVGQDSAARLASAGVATVVDFLRSTATADARAALALASAVHVNQLYHWAAAMELTRVANIDLKKVRWLEAAGISSLKALQGCSGRELELREKLEKAGKTLGLSEEVPASKEIKHWTAQALATVSQIKPEPDKQVFLELPGQGGPAVLTEE